MNRMEAMRRARDKLQAEVDAAATVEAEKMKEVCFHCALIESVLCWILRLSTKFLSS